MSSNNNSYDCIIIGGGLAGLTLSIQLAKQGFGVALFEKEQYPFHKVCGEYIAMESWNYLVDCGVQLNNMNLPRISKLHISSPNGNILKHNLNPGGFGISRFTLDYQLATVAKETGVNLFENTKVNDVIFDGEKFTITTNSNIFYSKIAFGSFGKRSNIDVKLNRKFIASTQRGLINYIGVKYHIKADLPANLIELHNFKDGYCGISKVDNERYCLCYLTTADNLKNNGGNIKQMEENVLMQNPLLKKYFTQYQHLYSEPLSISQINFSNKTQVENGLIMLGDAAGLIAPLCGNGMSMAMQSSKMLAILVPTFLNKKITKFELDNTYMFQWNKAFRTRLKVGRILQSMFGNEIITNLLISSLKPFPLVVNKLVSLTHGKPY